MSLTFSSHITKLFSLLTKEKDLNHKKRILLYKDLLTCTKEPMLSDLHTSVLSELQLYYRDLVRLNNDYYLTLAQNILYEWLPKVNKTVYQNPENAHVFVESAVKVASLLVKRYPAKYYRPTLSVFDNCVAKKFFSLIETDPPCNNISLKTLFSSVWSYINQHSLQSFFIQRLLEEIKDSVDVCVSGRFVRLINTINGIDDMYSFSLTSDIQNKSYIFHQLNKNVDMVDLENFEQNVKTCINSIDLKNISREDVLKILQDYTKTKWKMMTNKYVPNRE